MVHYLREYLVDEAALVLDDEGSSRVRPLQDVFQLRFLHLSLVSCRLNSILPTLSIFASDSRKFVKLLSSPSGGII